MVYISACTVETPEVKAEGRLIVDSGSEGWSACDFPVDGPLRWFSDVENILTADGCFMYTNTAGADIGDSSFRMVITPSGDANVTVVYDPPVLEGPECPAP